MNKLSRFLCGTAIGGVVLAEGMMLTGALPANGAIAIATGALLVMGAGIAYDEHARLSQGAQLSEAAPMPLDTVPQEALAPQPVDPILLINQNQYRPGQQG